MKKSGAEKSISRKIDNYEYLTGEEILPSNQRRVIEQGMFTYSPSGKTLEKEKNNRKLRKKTNRCYYKPKTNQRWKTSGFNQ